MYLIPINLDQFLNSGGTSETRKNPNGIDVHYIEFIKPNKNGTFVVAYTWEYEGVEIIALCDSYKKAMNVVDLAYQEYPGAFYIVYFYGVQ